MDRLQRAWMSGNSNCDDECELGSVQQKKVSISGTSQPKLDEKSQIKRQRKMPLKRQDSSWSGFKDKAFKVACTVVLPKPQRICVQTSSGTTQCRLKSISVKSLPQLKREEDARARRKLFTRSISEPRRIGFSPPSTPAEDMQVSFQNVGVCGKDDVAVTPNRVGSFYLPTANGQCGKKIVFYPRTSRILEEEEEYYEECEPALPPQIESRSPSDIRKNLDPYAVDELSAPERLSRIRILRKGLSLDLDLINNVKNTTNALVNEEVPSFPETTPTQALSNDRKFSIKSLEFQLREEDSLMALVGKNSATTPVSIQPMPSDEEYFSEEDNESLTYDDYYDCMPPPIFMILITIVEVGFFVYHTNKLVNNPKYGRIGKYGPAPLDSVLIYNPTRRHEIWRYFTYAFVHSGYLHIANNAIVQLILGVFLEICHKWRRVLCVYFAGVIFACLATSLTEPHNYLAGASGGVYALIAAHLSTVILNWKDMEHPWVRVLIFVAFLIHDAGTAIYFAYVIGEKTNVGYSAHIGGCVAGFLVGIHVLKNIHWSDWERVLWYTSIVICLCLLSFAIIWNIVRTDLFP